MNRNYMFDILAEDAEIIANGSVISFENKSIDLEFGNKKDSLKLHFWFDSDEHSKPYLKSEAMQGKNLKLTLYNFNSSLGSGIKPQVIGDLDGKKLYLGFYIYPIGDTTSKLFHYTIYLYGKA